MLHAALKGYDFLITLAISSLEIDIGEGISAGYEALGISVRWAFGMGEKNQDLKASTFSGGVVAMPVGVTRSGIVRGVGRRWLLSFTYFASGQNPLLPLAASATAGLKFVALAFLMADLLALSASR